MEKKQQLDISSTKAVLLGALAPGVNGPTWNTLKSAFLLLGVCLAVMFGLAFSSSDSLLILHVGFLVLIAASLFLLLSWDYMQVMKKQDFQLYSSGLCFTGEHLDMSVIQLCTYMGKKST